MRRAAAVRIPNGAHWTSSVLSGWILVAPARPLPLLLVLTYLHLAARAQVPRFIDLGRIKGQGENDRLT